MIVKRMMPMHYELYIDSLFFLNFIMNLFLLFLVDRSTLRMASPGRMAAGAAVGFPFCLKAKLSSSWRQERRWERRGCSASHSG